MKYKNIKTGAILEPNSKFTETQMEKSDLYVKVEEVKKSK